MSSPNQIRWLIHRDLPHVLDIERESFAKPWGVNEFEACLRCRENVGFVIENRFNTICGFMIVAYHTDRLELLTCAVAKQRRNMGLGTKMIDRVKLSILKSTRDRIRAVVTERNLSFQLFLHAVGFTATRSIRRHFQDGDDAIEFESVCKRRPVSTYCNRVTEYDT